MKTLSPFMALNYLKYQSQAYAFIDVRSEGEFEKGALLGFINRPILNNEHRHLVGVTYKQQGQNQAIKLGLELVTPLKEALMQSWIEKIQKSQSQVGVVTCWRGGIRSRFACQWLTEKSIEAYQVEAGFKAMRRELLKVFENLPPFIVLSGLTGSGKTQLLQKLPQGVLDLEGVAKHRGSSFGGILNDPQPAQVTFENQVALVLFQEPRTFVVEDESRLVGHCVLPDRLKSHMNEAPVYVLEVTLEDRIKNIFDEYVLCPLQKGVSVAELQTRLKEATQRVSRRLGGQLTTEVLNEIESAFKKGLELSHHGQWIETLLIQYYDKLYSYGINKKKQNIQFRGNFTECLEKLKHDLNEPIHNFCRGS